MSNGTWDRCKSCSAQNFLSVHKCINCRAYLGPQRAERKRRRLEDEKWQVERDAIASRRKAMGQTARDAAVERMELIKKLKVGAMKLALRQARQELKLEEEQRKSDKKEERKQLALDKIKTSGSVSVPVRFRVCQGCGSSMRHLSINFHEDHCIIDVRYTCGTEAEIHSGTRRIKGALVPMNNIERFTFEGTCSRLEALLAKAALELVARPDV